ncbi:toxin-antitoxin system YwqK family antitoxin [Ekhidna sp.]|uniref:toxin-antitoxin system YwqK family antitoxin n=1 Tax=Ekhidna sp. TaxID=2608089 RepID=UPI003BAB77C4
MNKTQILIALVIISIIGMSSAYLELFELVKDEPVVELEKPKIRDGEIRQYTKNKKLKTIVNYDNGIKHGTSYLYHDDGETVLLAMPYLKGKREGVSEKYYKTGKLYASTSYKDDKLHGIRKLYYSTGQLKAEINYGYGHPGIGTVEYLMDGTKNDKPKITSEKKGSIIWLDTSLPCDDQTFYIGKLIDDQFFNPLDENVRLLLAEEDKYYVDTQIHTPSYLKYQDIICACESKQGNPIILKERLY